MNNYCSSNWTYGAEYELADWDIRSELPSSVTRNLDDYSIANSNGLSNDPSGRNTTIGGELNTKPTDTIEGQIKILREIKEYLPDAKTNYHSNFHLHIAVPGLVDDLEALKYLQESIHKYMPSLLDIIDPLCCNRSDYDTDEDYKIAKKRINHSKVSRHKLLTADRLKAQLSASTVEEFFNAEPPISRTGKPQFQLAPRVCINLRSLLDNGTIEFRHWAGTMDEEQITNAFKWCKLFLDLVLSKKYSEDEFLSYSRSLNLPKQELVDPYIERVFNLTSVHKVGKETSYINSMKLLNGEKLW